jgi:hypothetical protein
MFLTHEGREFEVSRYLIKVRGEHFNLKDPKTVAPKIEHLMNILNGLDEVTSKTQWEQTALKTLTDWHRLDDCSLDAETLPGQSKTTVRGLSGRSLLRNHNQPAKTHRIYVKRESDKVGFDAYKSEGIKKLTARMVRDKK